MPKQAQEEEEEEEERESKMEIFVTLPPDQRCLAKEDNNHISNIEKLDCSKHFLDRIPTISFLALFVTKEIADTAVTRFQSNITCATALPAVVDCEGPSSIIKGPNIRSFVAKSVLSRFTRFLVVKAQTKHCQIGQLHD